MASTPPFAEPAATYAEAPALFAASTPERYAYRGSAGSSRDLHLLVLMRYYPEDAQDATQTLLKV